MSRVTLDDLSLRDVSLDKLPRLKELRGEEAEKEVPGYGKRSEQEKELPGENPIHASVPKPQN